MEALIAIKSDECKRIRPKQYLRHKHSSLLTQELTTIGKEHIKIFSNMTKAYVLKLFSSVIYKCLMFAPIKPNLMLVPTRVKNLSGVHSTVGSWFYTQTLY